jgi:GTP-binding protein Era
MHRSGTVALLGRPNVGKSTLLNRLVGVKVSIVSDKPQTTRRRLLGILTRDDCQILFFDTPGMHKPRDLLNRYMVDEIETSLGDADLAVCMLEANLPLGQGDRFLLERLRRSDVPFMVAINKIDLVSPGEIGDRTREVRDVCPEGAVLTISAARGDGCEGLLSAIVERLSEGPAYFPPEQASDETERFIAGEVIREAALRHTRQEVPHSVAVVVDDWKDPREEGRKAVVSATLYVEHESQKGIVIGQGGSRLKKIGTEARKDIETMAGRPVYLDLRVKVRQRWRKDPTALKEFGYGDRKGGSH